MASFRDTVVVTASGSNGSAAGAGETTRRIHGVILAVYLERTTNPVNSTDVIIREANRSPALPVLTVSNLSASGWYYPRLALHNAVDGSAIVGPVDYVTVDSELEVVVAQANNGSVITAVIEWEPVKP